MEHTENAALDAGTPTPVHLVTEFFVWLWYISERDGGQTALDGGSDGPAERVDVWVDERLSFRNPDDDKPRAVLTGENTATALEARAALAGGKVVRDLQVHVRREEREYTVTLRGPHLDLVGLKLPAGLAPTSDGGAEVFYERMYLYDDLWYVLSALYRRFARERTSPAWRTETLPGIRAWVAAATP